MLANEIKKAANLYFEEKLAFDKDYLINDETDWLDRAIWWFEAKYDLTSWIDEDIEGKDLHEKHVKLFVRYALERRNFLYEMLHGWDDAVSEFYDILDNVLPNTIARLEDSKDRLIAGNNKDIWNDGKKIREYYDSERAAKRREIIETIINNLNKAKEHLYKFQKIL